MVNYADDTTMHTFNGNKGSAIGVLETSTSLLFGWFSNNFMKSNSEKRCLIVSGKEPTTAMIDGLSIESNKTEVPLDIKIEK